MNAIYAGNFFVVQNKVMLLLSACGETERRKDDEKDVVVEGYDREKRNRFCRKIRKCSERSSACGRLGKRESIAPQAACLQKSEVVKCS